MIGNAASSVFEIGSLNKMKKDELVEIIQALQEEKGALQQKLLASEDNSLYDRVSKLERDQIELERSHYLYMQYGRRESVEISGIPEDPNETTAKLQDEVIKVYEKAGVIVEGRGLEKMDISSCHRIGKKGTTICRFVNRKFAWTGIANSKNLKDSGLYDSDVTSIVIFANRFSRLASLFAI